MHSCLIHLITPWLLQACPFDIHCEIGSVVQFRQFLVGSDVQFCQFMVGSGSGS
jgi:hypothetical protein